MTIDTAQYTEFLERGQAPVRQAVDAWTRLVSAATADVPALSAPGDAEAAIDRYFDMSVELLGAQRAFAKRLVSYRAAGSVRQPKGEDAPADAAA